MTDTVQYFGQLLPEKRIANVAGIEVDVTRIPARLSLEAMKLSDGGKPDIEGVVKLLAKICQTSAPEITEDFLLDHLDITEIGSMMRFINPDTVSNVFARQATINPIPAKHAPPDTMTSNSIATDPATPTPNAK